VEGFLLDPSAWDKVGAFVVLLLFVLLIATGRLLPRSWVDARLREKDEEIRDLRIANDKQRDGFGTVDDYLTSMKQLAESERRRRDSVLPTSERDAPG
jgi:hypothetical protein